MGPDDAALLFEYASALKERGGRDVDVSNLNSVQTDFPSFFPPFDVLVAETDCLVSTAFRHWRPSNVY